MFPNKPGTVSPGLTLLGVGRNTSGHPWGIPAVILSRQLTTILTCCPPDRARVIFTNARPTSSLARPLQQLSSARRLGLLPLHKQTDSFRGQPCHLGWQGTRQTRSRSGPTDRIVGEWQAQGLGVTPSPPGWGRTSLGTGSLQGGASLSVQLDAQGSPRRVGVRAPWHTHGLPVAWHLQQWCRCFWS